MTVRCLTRTSVAWILASLAGLATAAAQNDRQRYPNAPGELLLENDRVIVQRFVFQPGESEGSHSHPGHQLLVYIKGGVWTDATGRSTIWKDGRVVYEGPSRELSEDSR
jgi:quercetin dioxygenase-like cupin family protein